MAPLEDPTNVGRWLDWARGEVQLAALVGQLDESGRRAAHAALGTLACETDVWHCLSCGVRLVGSYGGRGRPAENVCLDCQATWREVEAVEELARL